MPPVSLRDLVLHEATHCGQCHEERETVAEIDGVRVCRQCELAADRAASQAIEDAREGRP